MAHYLIVGAGSIGSAVGELLTGEQHQVTVVTRRGTGPEHPLITRVAADGTDAARLSALARGTDAIFNCANPPYHRWTTDWPPLAAALLRAGELSGAVLVTMGNLYPYGRPAGPMTTETPFRGEYAKAQVRAAMWHDALAAHDAGRLRVSEVRASDFIGPDSQSLLSQRLLKRILAGRSCAVFGELDVAHSWSYTHDAARTLVACAQAPEAWGRAWHVPTNPPRTQRELINDVADAAGVRRVPVRTIPLIVLRAVGLFNPLARELPTTLYQFNEPFIIGDAATRSTLGLEPTPWPEVLAATIGGPVVARNTPGTSTGESAAR